MTYTFLSGGTGTPKLLQGFRELVADKELNVICNTGDDLKWFGLHVSPDLDTVLYLFADLLDLSKFWGVKGDEFATIEMIDSLDEMSWFNIGNKDLGLHLVRSKWLKEGFTLTEISQKICARWGIESTIVPMSDQKIQSMIATDIGKLSFQEYFVKYSWKPEVSNVEFIGEEKSTPPSTIELLDTANKIIIGPSNPVTSIGPILSIPIFKQTLSNNRSKTIAISPIVGNNAFSGPSAILMKAKGIPVNPGALASYYSDYISYLVLDPSDRDYKEQIEDNDIEAVYIPIELKTLEDKVQLAKDIIELF